MLAGQRRRQRERESEKSPPSGDGVVIVPALEISSWGLGPACTHVQRVFHATGSMTHTTELAMWDPGHVGAFTPTPPAGPKPAS